MRRLFWLALSAILLLLGGCSTPKGNQPEGAPAKADLVLDLDNLAQPYLGLGAQIWTGDTAWVGPMEALNARWARVSMAPSFDQTPERAPTGASRDEMDAFMARNYSAVFETQLAHAIDTWERLQHRDMQVILHIWEAPSYWEAGGTLHAKHIPDYARLWGSLLFYLDESGIRPTWIELSNEPDGDWNTRVHPPDYGQLVTAVRAELDARGFQEVGILGPGLSTLNHRGGAERWIGALDDGALASLGGWSVHTWDGFAERGEGKAFLESRWAAFVGALEKKDPQKSKPIFVTELGSKDTEFNGFRYTTPDNSACGDAADSIPYAVRILDQVFTSLNHGASALVIWQAADQSWECSNWGLVTSAEEGAEPRPVFHALKSLADQVPRGARVIRATWHDPLLSVAALRADERVVVGIANGSAETVTRTLAFSGTAEHDWMASTAFSKAGVVQEQLVGAAADAAIEVVLPAESVKVLALKARSQP
jgi:hypothetical protein